MRVYYDLVVWEEIDENDTDNLKGKFMEMGKRLQSYGILSFNMRAAPQAQPQPATEAPAEEGAGQQEDVEYVDEKGNPVTPTEDDTIVDE